MSNTKTITIKGGIFLWTWADQRGYDDARYRFIAGDAAIHSDDEKIFIAAHEIVAEIPADFDPRPEQIKALEAKRKELQAQFAAAVTEINRQISQLQAIEHCEA